jgi:hypothetical protein
MWANPDPWHLLVRRPWWYGLGYRDDFDRFVIVVYDSDDDHVIIFFFSSGFFFFFDDFFFSFSFTQWWKHRLSLCNWVWAQGHTLDGTWRFPTTPRGGSQIWGFHQPIGRWIGGRWRRSFKNTNPRVRGVGRLLTWRSGPEVPSSPAKPVQI